MWLGGGAFLVIITLARPGWFWDNYRTRWLRSLVGDEATAACYLVLAGVMVWVGLFTDWTFGRQSGERRKTQRSLGRCAGGCSS